VGRAPGEVRLLLATKTLDAAPIREAIVAGGTLIGENRVQELQAKAQGLSDLPHETHLIGPLQRNKAKAAVQHADCIETVADLKIAQRIDRLAGDQGKRLDVFIQVNTSGEETKSGCAPTEAGRLAAAVAALEHLRLRGFMTIGLNSPDQVAVGLSFARLREIRDAVIVAGAPGTAEATELSMGMSGDFELAIAEGATIVRVGSAVFGPRDYPAAA
jgi:pyridoxal phosphate enzyme (YggS family)